MSICQKQKVRPGIMECIIGSGRKHSHSFHQSQSFFLFSSGVWFQSWIFYFFFLPFIPAHPAHSAGHHLSLCLSSFGPLFYHLLAFLSPLHFLFSLHGNPDLTSFFIHTTLAIALLQWVTWLFFPPGGGWDGWFRTWMRQFLAVNCSIVPCPAESNWNQELQKESLETALVRLHLVTLWDVGHSGPGHW